MLNQQAPIEPDWKSRSRHCDATSGGCSSRRTSELLKRELGIGQPLTNREKTQLVDALREDYALTELLSEVGLPRSSYFYQRARLQIADKYADAR